MGHAVRLAQASQELDPMAPELKTAAATVVAAATTADDGAGWCSEHHRGSHNPFLGLAHALEVR